MLRFTIFALLLSVPACSASAAKLASPAIAPQSIAPSTVQASQAASHLNQAATVCGPITGKHTVAGVGTLIDLGPSSPNPPFRVIVWSSDQRQVGDLPSTGNICVSGVIGQAQGIPQIVLSDAKSWALNETSGPAAAPPRPATRATATAPAKPAPPKTNSAPSTAAAPSATVVPSEPAPSTPVRSSAAPATSPSYRIGPDDALQITVWKEPTLSGAFLVRPDGMISLVLLGDVPASGRTPMQLAADLTQRLKKFLQDPLVAVTVQAANSQRIYLMGEVQKVGPLDMATTMSPLQAIAAAGGLTPYANKKKIYILRGPADKQRKIPFDYKAALKGNPNASITLMAGDTIVVP